MRMRRVGDASGPDRSSSIPGRASCDVRSVFGVGGGVEVESGAGPQAREQYLIVVAREVVTACKSRRSLSYVRAMDTSVQHTYL
jgi:hypothetical protein